MMSEHLCVVRIDLTTVPKNNRIDSVLKMVNYCNNSFRVFEPKKARVTIFPSETKHLYGILSKGTRCYSNFNKTLLHTVQNKNIFLFYKGEVIVLEENILTTFEISSGIEFSCVELKYNSTQGRLVLPVHQKPIKNARKVIIPRPLDTLTYNTSTCMINDPQYANGTTSSQYDNGTSSLQFCIANVVQPNIEVHSRVNVHSDGGASSQLSDGQTISSLGQNSFGNSRSENSFNSIQADAALLNVESEYEQHPRHPLFADYDKRKATFTTWPQFVVFNTEALARAGLFCYTGEDTVVRCYFCGTELSNLTPDDDPLAEHFRKLPSCGYLKRILEQRRIAEYQAQSCNGTILSQQTNEDPSRVTSRNLGSWSASDRIRSPQYQAYSIRLSTFDRWPSDISQTPAQVADAGFYYTGLEDVVRCFACDGGLKNWDHEDDPWVEHARWFQECPFVKRVKGQEFIDLVRRMTEEEDEEEDAVVHSTFQPNIPTQRNELNYQLEQENSEHVLETDAAKCALNEGFSREMVAKAINELLMNGKSNYSSKDITEFIKKMTENDGLTMGAQGTMNSSTMSEPSSQRTDSKRSIFEENQRLLQKMQCVTCKAATKEILFLPCTHLCLCSHCSDKSSICPICYKKIRDKIKTYVI